MGWFQRIRSRLKSPPVHEAAGRGRRSVVWTPGNPGAVAAMLATHSELRAKSRDLVRRNAWASTAVEAFVANAVGTGIKPQSLVDDAELRKAIQSLWWTWTEEADSIGTLADAVVAMRAELDPPIHTNLPPPQEALTMEHHDPDPTAHDPVAADPTEPEETRIAAAVEAARADARAIADLCLLAGCPEKTAGFLAQGLTQEAVREALLEYRAKAPEIASHIDPQRTSPAASLDDNPVVAAARKRVAKEV